jgi:hypothetical protein
VRAGVTCQLLAITAKRGGPRTTSSTTTTVVQVEFGGAYPGAQGAYTGERWTTPVETFLDGTLVTYNQVTTKVRTRHRHPHSVCSLGLPCGEERRETLPLEWRTPRGLRQARLATLCCRSACSFVHEHADAWRRRRGAEPGSRNTKTAGRACGGQTFDFPTKPDTMWLYTADATDPWGVYKFSLMCECELIIRKGPWPTIWPYKARSAVPGLWVGEISPEVTSYEYTFDNACSKAPTVVETCDVVSCRRAPCSDSVDAVTSLSSPPP